MRERGPFSFARNARVGRRARDICKGILVIGGKEGGGARTRVYVHMYRHTVQSPQFQNGLDCETSPKDSLSLAPQNTLSALGQTAFSVRRMRERCRPFSSLSLLCVCTISEHTHNNTQTHTCPSSFSWCLCVVRVHVRHYKCVFVDVFPGLS